MGQSSGTVFLAAHACKGLLISRARSVCNLAGKRKREIPSTRHRTRAIRDTDRTQPIYCPLVSENPQVINEIRASVAEEFVQVNDLIVNQLRSNVDMVENVGQYIVAAGGKRLRPLIVLLTGQALGNLTDKHIKFAAVIEFIHTATLLHDDVVDISSLRRGRLTANEAFGNAPSVLVGDFLYTRAFQLMVELADLRLLRNMADTTNTIAEGEVLQLVRAGDASVNEAQYLEVIERKTAILFGAACKGASLLQGANDERQQQLYDFGLHLGVAFQMIDDVLDYAGDPAVTGKNIGDDLSEGKPTLPLIHVMKTGSAADRALIERALTHKTTDELEAVIAAVLRSGGVDYTHERALYHRDQALAAITDLQASPAKQALEQLAGLATNRAV